MIHTVKFNKPVSFTDHTGVEFVNMTTGETAAPELAAPLYLTDETSPSDILTYNNVGWVNDPVIGDVIEWQYNAAAIGANYGEANGYKLTVPSSGTATVNLSSNPVESGTLCNLVFEAVTAQTLIRYTASGGTPVTKDLDGLASPHSFALGVGATGEDLLIENITGEDAVFTLVEMNGVASETGNQYVTDPMFETGCGGEWICAGGASIDAEVIPMESQELEITNCQGSINGRFVTVGTGADYATIELAVAAIPAMNPSASSPVYMRLTQETHSLGNAPVVMPSYSGIIGEVTDSTKCIVEGFPDRSAGLEFACISLGLNGLFKSFTLDADTGSISPAGAGFGCDLADITGVTNWDNITMPAHGDDNFYLRSAGTFNIKNSDINVYFDGFAMFGDNVDQTLNLDNVTMNNDSTKAGACNLIRVDNNDTIVTVDNSDLKLTLPATNLISRAHVLGTGATGGGSASYDFTAKNSTVTIENLGARAGTNYAFGLEMNDGRLDLDNVDFVSVDEIYLVQDVVQDSLLTLGNVSNLTTGITNCTVTATTQTAEEMQIDKGGNTVAGFKIP